MGNVAAIEPLVAIARDENQMVRQAAERALEQLNYVPSQPAPQALATAEG
jgi:HEAT repeat protein